MRDIPAQLSGYTFLVTGEPEGKVNDAGEAVLDKKTSQQPFAVLLLAKPKPVPGEPRRKDGEEIKVNLPKDPGPGFEAGTFVELLNPVINTYEMTDPEDSRRIINAGIWWKADGLKPVTRPSAVKPPAAPASPSPAGGAEKAGKAA
jgi:hypothetical protein